MRLAVGVIMLALVAGCGSSPVAYEEAPGDPVELTVPGDASALAPASATATPTPTRAPDDDAATQPRPSRRPRRDPSRRRPRPRAPRAAEPRRRPARARAAGTTPDSEASEEFCTQNPGAC